jgi:hypothetical protein
MKYPIGTTLRLIDTTNMLASHGAIAVVTGNPTDNTVSVSWIKDGNNQSNGNYYVNRFEAVDPREVLDLKIADLQAQRAALDEVYVGDTVKTAKNNTATVIAIVGEEAWVRTKRGQNIVSKLTDLKKVY